MTLRRLHAIGLLVLLVLLAASCSKMQSSPAAPTAAPPSGPTMTGLTLNTTSETIYEQHYKMGVFATATYSDGTKADVSAKAVWTNSDPSVLTFDGPFVLLTFLANGKSIITASYQGFTASAVFNVQLQANMRLTGDFYRFCNPYQTAIHVWMTNMGHEYWARVTSVAVSITDANGVVRYTKVLSGADLAKVIPNPEILPQTSLTLLDATVTYPMAVDTKGSIAGISVTLVDQRGNTLNPSDHRIPQVDACQ